MKFNIAKSDLMNVLAMVSKGMSSRSTLPILSGILIDASMQNVVFQTTDLEISIKHTVFADVEETGRTVIPGKLLSDIAKALPDAAVTIETKGEQVSIECLTSSFTLSTLNPADFPYFPQVETSNQVTLHGSDLSEVVKRVSKSVSRDESRAILTGILFSVEGSSVRFVATDSYRLAVADLNVDGLDEGTSFSAIIPGRIFEDISRLVGSDQDVVLGFSENQIVFTFGTTIFVSRKIEGTYPNYKQLLPKDKSVSIRMDAGELTTAIRRVSLLAQSHTPVRFSFSAQNQSVTISAKTQDVGGAKEEMDAAIDGSDIEIAFNHQYLLDGLSAIRGDVVIELQTSLKPGILKPADSSDYLYLAMPVRLG